MTTKIKPLKDLPIAFNEELHQYRWLPTNEVMGTSVTQVVSVNKTAAQLANIEKHKATWEPTRRQAVDDVLLRWGQTATGWLNAS